MKKNIFLWSLYDFANSIVMMVFLFYFSQWLVIDSGKPDWWYNSTLIISSLLFVLTAPIAGQRLDATKKKLSGVRISTLFASLFFSVTALITILIPSFALLAAIFFTLATYFYLMNFVYYTPMINDLSDENNRGWVSGLGTGANFIGQVFGLLITLPFAKGSMYLFGIHGRAQTLLPAVILFILLSLPMILLYKENIQTEMNEKINIKDEYRKVIGTIKGIFSIRNLALCLVAYFLFSDAVLTFSNNFPIFLERVFNTADSVKTYLTVGVLILASTGSVVFGKIADKKGSKSTLIFLLICWTLLFPMIAFSPSMSIEIVVCLIAGFMLGPVFGVSRSMIVEYAPKESIATTFSFYTVAERFATFIGPIIWSTILISTSSSGSISYSYAVASLSLLTIIGLLLVNKIKSNNPII